MEDLSVRNVKLHEDMSEETTCFSADVYKDGKLIAHAKNSGHGGCNDYYPAKGVMPKDIGYLMGLDYDSHIMELVEEYNIVTKNQSKGLVLKNEGGAVFTYKLIGKSIPQAKKSPTFYSWLERQRVKLKKDGYTIINRNL